MADLSKYSTSPMKYTDYLRKQGQDQLKEIQSQPDVGSQVQPLQDFLNNQQVLADKQKQAQEAQNNPYYMSVNPDATLPSQSAVLSRGGPITQAFGAENPGVEVFSHGFNSGTDIGVPEGTQLALPPGKWKILQSFANAQGPGYIGNDTNSGYGNSVFAQNEGTGEKLRFSHLSKVGVNPNQELNGGSVIGLTGATGNVTGPHLDLEYYNKLGQLSDVLKSVYGRYLNTRG